MKISYNNEALFTLSEIQKKVIRNDIPEDIFEADMQRRLHWCIHHPATRFIKQNAKSAREFLKSRGVKEIPSDPMEFASFVFEHAPVNLSQEESVETSIKIDDIECFKVSDTTKKLLKSQVSKHCECSEYMKERLKWILSHKYERCMERLRKEWEPKLIKRGVVSFPVDDDEFAELVFKQPDYKNRSQRDLNINSEE